LATEAGLSALKAGGIAIEAASAIVATIGVVYPHFCGLGARERRVAHRRPRPRDYFSASAGRRVTLQDFQTNIPFARPLSMLTSACAVDTPRHAHEYSTEHLATNPSSHGPRRSLAWRTN